MTNSGWTQPVLREFLAFAGFKGISTIAIWTDGSMETKRLYPNGNPLLATCEWWVPELRRWVVAGRSPETCDQAVVMAACMDAVANGVGGGGGQESQDNFCTGSCVATLTAFNAQCSDGGDGDISELLASVESMCGENDLAVLKSDDDFSKTQELYVQMPAATGATGATGRNWRNWRKMAAATGGSDGSPGRPFASVGEAVAAVRAIPLPRRCGVTVTIAGGVYGGPANNVRLTDADSGCPGAPVIYRAAPGDPAAVLLHGGVEVPVSAFHKNLTTAGGLVIWSADLALLGLASLGSTSGSFKTGWNCANGDRTELFFGGQAMTLARHPNKAGASGNGTWQYLRQGKTLTPSSFGAGTDDTTGGQPVPALSAWAADATDLWVHGFWTWDWADSFAKVASIDSAGAVTVKDGPPPYGLQEGSRYMMVNSLSLLDAPSEYFISSAGDALYFIPPVGTDVKHPPAGQGVFLSQQQHAHVMDGASHIELRGLRLEYAMDSAVSAQNVTNVKIENCSISNSGTDGIELLNATGTTVSGCHVFDTGCNALKMDGGDIPSLTAGNLLVHNNSLHRFARVTRTRSVGIMWSGCGSVVSSNEIYDGPYIGILMNGHGVLHVFEDNDLHDLAQGVADSAGFYAGRTWSDRGNTVRRNRFRRFLTTEKLAQGTSINGIYLDVSRFRPCTPFVPASERATGDAVRCLPSSHALRGSNMLALILLSNFMWQDMESGWLIEDNHFEEIRICMFIGGGRQNSVLRNTFVNCSVPVHVDDRGMNWMKCGANQTYPAAFMAELTALNYLKPPWSTRFPDIDTTTTPCAPSLNRVLDNRYCFPHSPPAPPPPAGSCAECPAGRFGYGDGIAGSWCCSVQPNNDGCPSAQICCLTPGTTKKSKYGDHGCEGIARCGNNPSNKTACTPVPALPAFTDFAEEVGNVLPAWKNVFKNNTEYSCLPSMKLDDDAASDGAHPVCGPPRWPRAPAFVGIRRGRTSTGQARPMVWLPSPACQWCCILSGRLQVKSDDAVSSRMATSALQIRKLGLNLPGFYETTPIMWHGRLLLVETIHGGQVTLASPAQAWPNQNHTYYRVREPGYAGALVVPVVPGSIGFHFVAAVTNDDPTADGKSALWISGTVEPTGFPNHTRSQVYVWVSRDAELKGWNRSLALQLPAGYSAWNTDITSTGGDSETRTWVMAIELGNPVSVVGVPFSTAFAVCFRCGTDLSRGWSLLDPVTHLFTKARYNACPTIRFIDPYFYLLTLFDNLGGKFSTVIVRSKDLQSWSPSPASPTIALAPDNSPGSPEHHAMPGSVLDGCGSPDSGCTKFLAPGFPGVHWRANMANYTDIDASDIDFVEVPGNKTHPNPKTFIVYCTGNQRSGYAYNAMAEVDAPMSTWLQSFFPAHDTLATTRGKTDDSSAVDEAATSAIARRNASCRHHPCSREPRGLQLGAPSMKLDDDAALDGEQSVRRVAWVRGSGRARHAWGVHQLVREE